MLHSSGHICQGKKEPAGPPETHHNCERARRRVPLSYSLLNLHVGEGLPSSLERGEEGRFGKGGKDPGVARKSDGSMAWERLCRAGGKLAFRKKESQSKNAARGPRARTMKTLGSWVCPGPSITFSKAVYRKEGKLPPVCKKKSRGGPWGGTADAVGRVQRTGPSFSAQ